MSGFDIQGIGEMSQATTIPAPSRDPTPRALLTDAVHRSRAASRQGLLERLFTFAFSGLVYPQIWEDPVPDLEALALQPDSHLVTIASGGCNVLAYLTANPRRITAVDLNRAHIALNELKLAALKHLPDHADFERFFRRADSPQNVELYDRLLAPRMTDRARTYWEGKRIGLPGRERRRIGLFAENVYRAGLLGWCITSGHLMAKLYGIRFDCLLGATTLEEQRRLFEREIAPLFDRRLIRFLSSSPIALYGLGIPPAQYRELAGDRHVADVLRERLARLATDFPLKDNYFAWQAFKRAYPEDRETGLPLYLQRRHFQTLRERADRVRLVRRSITDVLNDQPRRSVDAVVLLDAQDWMTPAQLNALWQALTRACRLDARVIFRTAGVPSILPGQVEPHLLHRWDYDFECSKHLHAKDRSAIYGGFHLYRLKG